MCTIYLYTQLNTSYMDITSLHLTITSTSETPQTPPPPARARPNPTPHFSHYDHIQLKVRITD